MKRKAVKHPIQKYLPVLIFSVFACLYLVFIQNYLKAGVRGGDLELGESQVRLKHVPPTSWTSDDVSAWYEYAWPDFLPYHDFNGIVVSRLVSIDLPHLKKPFKSNGVNGPVLLELNERIIMRDLLVTNEANVKRLRNIFILVYLCFHSSIASQATAGNQNLESCPQHIT